MAGGTRAGLDEVPTIDSVAHCKANVFASGYVATWHERKIALKGDNPCPRRRHLNPLVSDTYGTTRLPPEQTPFLLVPNRDEQTRATPGMASTPMSRW